MLLTRRQPVSTFGLIAIFVVFALGLLLQPERWSSTPAYGNLLLILSAPSWGLVYLVAAAVLALAVLAPRYRMLAIGAHLLAFALLAAWEAAFIVRYATDAKTTVVNVVSWGAYLALVVQSARYIDAPDVADEPVTG